VAIINKRFRQLLNSSPQVLHYISGKIPQFNYTLKKDSSTIGIIVFVYEKNKREKEAKEGP